LSALVANKVCITWTKFNRFSLFLAQVIFTFKVTEKIIKTIITTCTAAAVKFLERETPEFISLLLRPPNPPDLNSFDYSMWSVLQKEVYKMHITDLDDLRQCMRTEWAKLDHSVIAAAVHQ